MTQTPTDRPTRPTTPRAAAGDRPARPAPRARKPRGEGQWALGYREPLNPNEQSKKDDNPLNVRARIENIYAHRGFASIDPGDLRGRFRWYGLYTQRKPGIDGGKTATLEPHELDDEYFMLRIRIDGGALTSEQLRVIGQISVDFARDSADITDRQNVQLHWIRVEDVPEIWRRLEAVGLSTTEACGDCPRVILGSPVAGIAADEIIDPTSAIADIVDRYIGDPQYSNLPRKFKTAITGHPLQDVVPEINDVAFVGVEHPEYGPGFDLWVGGGLSTNPMLAQRLGAWVPSEEVAEAWAGVCGVFRDYGYRRLRTRARIKFLIADWGPEKFRDVLENEYLKRKLIDGPAPVTPERPGDHVGRQRAEGRQLLRRSLPHRRADGRPEADRPGRPRRGARVVPAAHHPDAEDPGPRRGAGPGRRPGRRGRGDRSVGPAERLAPVGDGLHRDRVLQARHRRDQGPGGPGGRRAGDPARRDRHPDHRPPQRLPELLRPDPGRRHRVEGSARARSGR